MIYLNEPTGKKVSNPTVEDLKEILFKNDKEFWKRSNEMELLYNTPKGDIVLLMIHSEIDNLFYLEYISPYANTPEFVVYNDDADKEKIITVYVGGEPHEFTATTFVSADIALEAVKTFINEKGKMADKIKWIDSTEVELCGGDEEDDEDDDDEEEDFF